MMTFKNFSSETEVSFILAAETNKSFFVKKAFFILTLGLGEILYNRNL